MSDASAQEILDWVEKCVANPDAALTAADGMVEQDPSAENGYLVHASRFLAFGRLALDRAERNADGNSEETLALCAGSIREYSRARNAEDSIYVEDEVQKETVVVKPAGVFTKARTEVREVKLQRTRNVMDWSPFENHFDAVAIILEKARPKSVQQFLGKTKLLYMLMADRLSHSNAFQRQISENESIKRTFVRSAESSLKPLLRLVLHCLRDT
jgi:hypothetical protein